MDKGIFFTVSVAKIGEQDATGVVVRVTAGDQRIDCDNTTINVRGKSHTEVHCRMNLTDPYVTVRATATYDAWKYFEDSDSIRLNFPVLSVSYNTSSPRVGEEVALNILVWNFAYEKASDVQLAVYVWGGKGRVSHSCNKTSVDVKARSSSHVFCSFTPQLPGDHWIYVFSNYAGSTFQKQTKLNVSSQPSPSLPLTPRVKEDSTLPPVTRASASQSLPPRQSGFELPISISALAVTFLYLRRRD